MSLPFVYLFVEVGMGPDMEHGMWNMAIRLHHQMEDPCGFAYHKGMIYLLVIAMNLVCLEVKSVWKSQLLPSLAYVQLRT
ncbi:hypothetical protein D917_03249 [Trichinella nativa]|uniref:Uncharacterized protein n=1 Tax=Trichinella nativa TaxID=6335 RepID=A0A1Y3E8Y0_9BILA|nr:hypothetical protein D917_03249 [Trichinella nativa]